MRVAVYVEGGGRRWQVNRACRAGFGALFRKAQLPRSPAVIPCGPRHDAFKQFCRALADSDEYPILLVDSETQVTQQPWRHLETQDNWNQPAGTDEDQAQLMVQCMETWCAADRSALQHFFGPDLNEKKLPPLNDLEERPKDRVQDDLREATRPCGEERMYRKGRRSFELLAKLNPTVLKEHLPHFRRLCDALERRLSQRSGDPRRRVTNRYP